MYSKHGTRAGSITRCELDMGKTFIQFDLSFNVCTNFAFVSSQRQTTGVLMLVAILENQLMQMGGNIKQTLKPLHGQGDSISVETAVDVADGQGLVL